MVFSITRSTFTKGAIVFVVISITVMVGILFWTTDRETWFHLSEFKLTLIPLLIGLGTLRWILDGMAFVSMAKHSANASIGIGRAAIIRLEGNFVGSVAPVLVGAVSMHAYLLHKQKLKLSESIAITALRAFLPILIFLLNVPIYFLMKSNFTDQFFYQLMKVISVPLAIIVLFLIIAMFYPDRIKKAASLLIRLWGRIKIIHLKRIIDIEEKFFHEVDQFSKTFWTYFKDRKLTLVLATFWILSAFIVDYLIGIAILWGFGYNPSFFKVIAMQCLMKPIIYLAPTPGGAGFWEFTYLGFFSLFMPHRLIGVAVLLWRIIITYIPSIFGAFFLTKDFDKDRKLREIVMEKGSFSDQDLMNHEER